MPKQTLAIALCRVSSKEQLENNSLNRQRAAVIEAASSLGVTIPDDCWWSGDVSSKRGTNLKRKDLIAIIEKCKRDKRIGYVIVDEPDRFMRSINEAAYFEVTFEQLGVKVWYASDPDLNKGDLASKLLKFTKYLSAEGSNEERQRKSIAGQIKALQEGRYPFSPKPGYMRGYERGIQEIHPTRGPILKTILTRLAGSLTTPTEALAELNRSSFMEAHTTYKMDKFRKIVTDPFYAGIVEIHKQVDYRNENGLHESLITKKQHQALLTIMDRKRKNQLGPRKNGNPKYPCNNLISCDLCLDKSNGRVVGFDHGNGKPNSKTYEKYRCRACRRYLSRQQLHEGVEKLFKQYTITDEGLAELTEALDAVWSQQEGEAEQEKSRLEHKIKSLKSSIAKQVESLSDPKYESIQDELLASIARRKNEVAELEEQLDRVNTQSNSDKQQFLEFAFSYLNDMGRNFLEASQQNRLRCKQIVFPAGLRLDANKKVYTPEISPLYRLAANKKDLSMTDKSLLVRFYNLVRTEFEREA